MPSKAKDKILRGAGFGVAALLLAACGPAARYAVMGSEQIGAVSEQCSRPNPPHYESTWPIAPEDVKQLEADLPQLNALAPANGNAHPGDADAYVRQYFAIVVNGRRQVYINGFLEPMANGDWKKFGMVVCDGGASAWGAVYDMESHAFSQLKFNGAG